MATITRGRGDTLIKKLKAVLEKYEQEHPGARAILYRHQGAIRPGPIRIRIVDNRFAKWSKPQRHDEVWHFITDQLTDDEVQEISILLLLSEAEQNSSLMNSEFEDPVD